MATILPIQKDADNDAFLIPHAHPITMSDKVRKGAVLICQSFVAVKLV